jgi:hypothetical protein
MQAGAASGASSASAADLLELRELLVAAKAEQDALRAERDEVRHVGGDGMGRDRTGQERTG